MILKCSEQQKITNSSFLCQCVCQTLNPLNDVGWRIKLKAFTSRTLWEYLSSTLNVLLFPLYLFKIQSIRWFLRVYLNNPLFSNLYKCFMQIMSRKRKTKSETELFIVFTCKQIPEFVRQNFYRWKNRIRVKTV